MGNIMSNSEDVLKFALALKNEMGDDVSINYYHLSGLILEGRVAKIGQKLSRYDIGPLRFYIKYNKDYFLRLQIDNYNDIENQKKAFDQLINAISKLNINGEAFGEPFATYKACSDEKDKVLTSEWVFDNIIQYESALRNNTLFDDGAYIEDLVITKNKVYKK